MKGIFFIRFCFFFAARTQRHQRQRCCFQTKGHRYDALSLKLKLSFCIKQRKERRRKWQRTRSKKFSGGQQLGFEVKLQDGKAELLRGVADSCRQLKRQRRRSCCGYKAIGNQSLVQYVKRWRKNQRFNALKCRAIAIIQWQDPSKKSKPKEMFKGGVK